ncbi:MAG: trigger factor [Clostridiales bacterium]|nr:trigger factor [Clostridiales bacterium]
MKSTFDKQKNEATFREALTADEWNAELENAYNRTKGRYKVPGFRPGKAPRKFIEMHYGPGVFFDAAVDLCINRVYNEELKNHPELQVFGQPEVSFEKAEEGEAFAFTFKVTLYPEVKLGEYKGIKLPKIEYNVSDEDVAERIEADLKQASRAVPVDRAAKLGDTVVIDYVGSVDGVEFEGGKAEKYELKLGSNTFIPGFEDGLVGAVKDQELDVNVTFPEEYHAENLKGKAAVFKVKVHDVTEEEVPELTDEWVKERGRYETVDEYKSAVRENLEASAKSRTRNERIDAAMKAITDASECDIPEKIVNAEVDRMYHEFEHQMSHYGIKPEDYLKYSNSSVAQFREERKEPAARNIKMRQIMRAIIDAEKIEVTEEEITQKLRDPQVRAELEHVVKHNGGSAEDYAYNDMLTDKFFDFLLGNNEFVLDKAEEKPAEEKKPAAKKPAAKKAADNAEGEEKPAAKKAPAKKPAAKKTEPKA